MMPYFTFLERVIDEGIEAAKADYTKPEDKHRLEGAVAGFEVCRGKRPDQLKRLLTEASERSTRIRESKNIQVYWRARTMELEIEWVCNVVSAALMNSKLPTILIPTARGVMKAAEILGVNGIAEA